jgi:hypothetical protein
MRPVKVLFPLTVTLVLLASGLTAAHAEVVHRDDPTGDAPPRFDVASARYSHHPARVAVTAQIPDLGDAGWASLSVSRFRVFEAGYVVLMRKRADEQPRVRLTYFNHFELEPRRCAGVTGSWDDGEVVLSVPRSCLDGHARRNVFAQFAIGRGEHVDRAPAVRRLSSS